MGIKNVDLACAKCSAVTPHTVQTPNHMLHLLLTVLTAGLWLIAWIIVAMGSGGGKKTCQRCLIAPSGK